MFGADIALFALGNADCAAESEQRVDEVSRSAAAVAVAGLNGCIGCWYDCLPPLGPRRSPQIEADVGAGAAGGQ